MFTVYADDILLYDVDVPDLKLYSAVISAELNKAGTFVFTMYPGHPAYDSINKLKTIITVYRGNNLAFRGRVLNEETSFYKAKKITAEGELAFLVDSIQRPYDFLSGDKSTTVTAFFHYLINQHNSQVEPEQQFTPGRVTVTDADGNGVIVRSSTLYETTWEVIKDKLIKPLGGFVWVRNEGGTRYLDYLADFDEIGNQPIEFGRNLLDLDKIIAGEDVATVLLPLGAKDSDTGKRLTIASVNGGKDYLENTSAISNYRRITKTVTWDDVTIAKNLLTKARAYLSGMAALNTTVELSALDLTATGQAFDSFALGQKISVYSPAHNVQDYFLVQRITADLLAPENNTITVGKTYNTFTEQTQGNQATVSQAAASAAQAETQVVVVSQETTALRQDLNNNYMTTAATQQEITKQLTVSAYTKAQVDNKLDDLRRAIPPAPLTYNLTYSGGIVTGGSVADCNSIKQAVAAGNYNLNIKLTVNDTDTVVCRYSSRSTKDGDAGVDYVFAGFYWDDLGAYLAPYKVGFNDYNGAFTWFAEQF